MPRIVRAGLIQAGVGADAPQGMDRLKKYMIDKHVALIEQAAGEGVEVLCLMELFTGPYFCAEQDKRWYSLAESIPGGPTVRLMQELAKRFNPQRFDADAWASAAKSAGMKYAVLTTKHHDGFCLWPNQEASLARGYPWNSVETGPGRDLVGELLEACKAKGVRPGLYYSFMEWHNPLYENDKARYVDEVMIPQIQELFQKYQPQVFWPDGEWDHPDNLWKSREILAWIYNHAEDPELLAVNDR